MIVVVFLLVGFWLIMWAIIFTVGWFVMFQLYRFLKGQKEEAKAQPKVVNFKPRR